MIKQNHRLFVHSLNHDAKCYPKFPGDCSNAFMLPENKERVNQNVVTSHDLLKCFFIIFFSALLGELLHLSQM